MAYGLKVIYRLFIFKPFITFSFAGQLLGLTVVPNPLLVAQKWLFLYWDACLYAIPRLNLRGEGWRA
jgi:hypothetical protein